LPKARLAQLALTTLLALLLISGSNHSHTSCPWDLKRFGGVAVYLSGRWA
jgi:membrane-associated PAP2 superfamily phosphatase